MKRVMCSIALLFPLGAAASDTERPVDFNRDIRPILSDYCFRCHGPDEQQRVSDLRLDIRDTAFEDLGGTAAVVPGHPEQSELYLRITESDDEERMPPPESGKQLSAAQIERIRRWIEQGAEWEQHWAYMPPRKPGIPDVQHPTFVRNSIDRIVLARLRSAGREPSTPADRVTLIRRLSFDLTGLPPSPTDVDRFVNNSETGAYTEVVDRLLRSPHYGERMAMYWLDLVRYADTNGFHFDQHRDIHPYRDYVIRSFNSNKPFDQFTIEQIAGDLLPDATLEHNVASGYNRLNMVATEGGVQPKEYLAKYATDRVSTTATVWLGSTMACSECHDHKFDPFTMRDFYSFAAFFADLQEVGRYTIGIDALPPQIPVPTPEESAQIKRLNEEIVRLREQLQNAIPDDDPARMEWERQVRTELASQTNKWMRLRPQSTESRGGATLTPLHDDSVLTSGTNPDTDTYTVIVRTDRKQITGIRLEALTHPSLSLKSLSRGSGNFVLSELTVEDISTGPDAPQQILLAQAVADFSQQGFPVQDAIDGSRETGWSVAGFLRRTNCTAAFRFAAPLEGGPGTTLRIRMIHESEMPQNNIGRFRLAISAAREPGLADEEGLPARVLDAIDVVSARRTENQQSAIRNYYHTIAPAAVALRDKIAAVRKNREVVQASVAHTLVSRSVKPRVMRILNRGNWMDDTGEIVSPAVPAFLTEGESDDDLNRLDLARWLISPDNPLTARVFVNRLWKQFFGRGLVGTLDDFGSQGERPTHPELLDYLATEFMDSGWDVRQLVRLIVTSGTYRQSSQASPELVRSDPDNRLLARQSSYRLDAELVRDNALSISGLLNPTIGGRSVRPYQPDGYWQHANMAVGDAGVPKYIQDHEGNLYRRGLYTYWKRTFLHPAMLVFDAPTRESCCVDRPRSNTPLQALVLLNDVQFVEAARVFAERILREGGTTFETRLQYAFRQAVSRNPGQIEHDTLQRLHQQHRRQYENDPDSAGQVISVGESSSSEKPSVSELAAWTSVARVILNLHETITRD